MMFTFREKIVLFIAALGMLLLSAPVAGASPVPQPPCNGSPDLCNRPLNEVVLPGSHNSMSASELGWNLPNQTYSITNQLERGVRTLLFDTYYGETLMDGRVVIVNKEEGSATGAQTFMCHALCQLGAVDLKSELGRITDWLSANPREVLVFINQDAITAEDFAEAVGESGLLAHVYQGSMTSFPTVGEMVESGQRVVMTAEADSGTVPWYHRAYDGPMMETPYSFPSTPESPNGGLDDPAQLDETCRPNRGIEGSPLFLMNHWVTTGVLPEVERAAIVNAKGAVTARARACETRRGKLPNIVAVDFFGQGDVVGAVRQLNGLEKPVLNVTPPKAVVVKSKRKATYRLPVSNVGDAEANSVKVCATVPSGLARKPRCTMITSLPLGSSAVAKITVTTKKRFKRGKGTVRFLVYSSQPTVTTSARLTVKPLKKPKRRNSRR